MLRNYVVPVRLSLFFSILFRGGFDIYVRVYDEELFSRRKQMFTEFISSLSLLFFLFLLGCFLPGGVVVRR